MSAFFWIVVILGIAVAALGGARGRKTRGPRLFRTSRRGPIGKWLRKSARNGNIMPRGMSRKPRKWRP
jgi:hypothetical protein